MQKKVNNPNTIPIKVDTVKYKIRASIDNFYDMQKLRIQCGNRICAAIRQTDDETENDNISRLSRLSITGLQTSSLRNTSRAVEVWARLLKLLTILRSLSLKSTIIWLSSM